MTVPNENQQLRLPAGIGTAEFIAMMAGLMALGALAIDPMVPALPQIGRDLNVVNPNDRQNIITIFMTGVALGSLFFGPLSDRMGRRSTLIIAAIFQLAATLACALAPSFTVLLTARFIAGFNMASCRVLAISVVRDCSSGNAMARIMSLIMMIFMIFPVIAPSVGALVLLFASWRWIFGLLAAAILISNLWVLIRLPETLAPENRVNIGPRDLYGTFVRVVTHRNALGHMLASGVLMGSLVGFIVSIQQIFFDVFHAPGKLPLGFALITMWIALGSLFNSRLVERFGARRLSQGALIVMLAISVLHSLIGLLGYETLIIFMVLQTIALTSFSFSGSNLSAISMEPFQRGAGLASAIQTTLTTLLSAFLGGLIGAFFDGTTFPLTLGFTLFSCVALLAIAWAERWRLFARPGHAGLRKDMIV